MNTFHKIVQGSTGLTSPLNRPGVRPPPALDEPTRDAMWQQFRQY